MSPPERRPGDDGVRRIKQGRERAIDERLDGVHEEVERQGAIAAAGGAPATRGIRGVLREPGMRTVGDPDHDRVEPFLTQAEHRLVHPPVTRVARSGVEQVLAVEHVDHGIPAALGRRIRRHQAEQLHRASERGCLDVADPQIADHGVRRPWPDIGQPLGAHQRCGRPARRRADASQAASRLRRRAFRTFSRTIQRTSGSSSAIQRSKVAMPTSGAATMATLQP